MSGMGTLSLAALCCVVLLPLPLPAAAATLTLQDIKAAVLSPDNLQKYKYELVCLAFIALYSLVYLQGSTGIRKRARSWTSFLWHPQGVLVRNFTYHPGTLDPGARAWRESITTYRSYASGRRYCQYAMCTLEFKAKHDIFAQLWYFISPCDDVLQLDVVLNEGCMPPTVLMIGTSKAAKALLKQQRGISNFAKTVQISKDRATTWSTEHGKGWTVMAEQSSLFYDLINAEPAIAKAFASKWFKSALISSEDTSSSEPGGDDSSGSSGSNGSKEGGEGGTSGATASSGSGRAPRYHLRFEFVLPPEQQREDINQLLAAAFMLVDLVATYKVSPEMKKRAQELRLKLEQEAVKKISASRQGQLAQKRFERLEAERARARAAGPQALAKFEEKRQRQMQKKELKKRTVKM